MTHTSKDRDPIGNRFQVISVPSEIEVPVTNIVPRDSSQILRGSKKRLLEDLNYNLLQIAEWVHADQLVFEETRVGSRSQRRVVIAYLRDVANPGIVREVKDRLSVIRAETVLDSSYLERNLEDSHFSPFPQIENTDRPNIIETALLQGRIAIVTDGSPQVMLAPTVFTDLMDIPEDAFSRWYFAASFFRIARYIMFILAASLPAFYIALTSFGTEFLPTKLVFIIASVCEGAPFPIAFEAFMMMGVVEAVRMIIIHMPNMIGATLSLFAGIILMIAGIWGGFFGAPLAMVVTLTVITSFGIPGYDLRNAIRIIQFFTMIMASILGVFGFAISFFYITIHLVTLKSFGIPYMAPLAPFEGSGFFHAILRKTTVRMPQDETYKPQKKGDKDE